MASRYPPSARLRAVLRTKIKEVQDVLGVSSVGFAWQHLFTVPGETTDPVVYEEFTRRSEGRCWQAVMLSAPGPFHTVVHVLHVQTGEVYAGRVSDFVPYRWVNVNQDVANELRRFHHR